MLQRTKWTLILGLVVLLTMGVVTWGAAQAPIQVEPSVLRADQGGLVSLYASAPLTFTADYTVRLLNYGILATVYVNPTALQATVPAGLTAGDYTLWVLNANGVQVGVGTLRLIAPPAPTATPQPESPPPSGRPILTMRNYTVEPLQVRPGQEFTVSIEVYNNGSRAAENTMAIFPGGTFIPLGDKGHLFGQVHINATFVATQRFRVPASATNGIQQVEVKLAANDWEGNHYEYPAMIPVEVTGASTGAAPTGKPKILVEGATTTPEVIAPGTPFSLTLTLANRGNRAAINVMTHADSATAIPATGGNIVSTEILRVDGVVTVTLPLLLKPVKEGGRQGLTIMLEYGDYSGGGYSDQQTVGIDIDTSLANRPQLLIDAYHTEPASISPGDRFTLTLELANVGGGDAQRVMLALGGEEGEQLGAFVPIEGSNVSFVSAVTAGESEVITVRLMVAGNAETRAHNLPIALAYDTGGGTREKSTQRVSLMVFRRPQFKVSFYRPVEGTAMVGQPFPLPIEVVNSGTARFNIPTLEAVGETVEFIGESSTFVGNLDPGGSWTLDVMALPQAPGPLDVVVNVYYIDDLNQTQIFSQTLTVDVMEMPEGPDGPAGPDWPGGPDEVPQAPETLLQRIWRFVKAFLGLGS